MTDLMTALLPLLVGLITFTAVELVKRASAYVEAQPPLAKRGLAVAIALTVTLVAEWAGAVSPCALGAAEGCLGALTPTAVQGLVAALVAMATHSLTKRSDA